MFARETYYCHRGNHLMTYLLNGRCHVCGSSFIENLQFNNYDNVNDVLGFNIGAEEGDDRRTNLNCELLPICSDRPTMRLCGRQTPVFESYVLRLLIDYYFPYEHIQRTYQNYLTKLISLNKRFTFGLIPERFIASAGHLGSRLIYRLLGEGAPPMSPRRIDDIEMVTITEDNVNDVLKCSVCQEDYCLSETVRKTMCGHCFHYNCLKPWLLFRSTCPLCRLKFVE